MSANSRAGTAGNGGREARAFNCRRCGVCCQGRGGARLDQAGTLTAAAFLDLDEAEFRRRYLVPGVPPWDIGVDKSGYCLFHQGGVCGIHPVKPPLCRLWPFLPSILTRASAFGAARHSCPGLDPDLTWAEFRAAWADFAA